MELHQKLEDLSFQLLHINDQLQKLKIESNPKKEEKSFRRHRLRDTATSMRAPAPIFPNVVYFDLETTGLGKTADIRICEIGMVRASNGEQFQQYVNPTIDVSSSASRVHGLKKEFLSKHASWEHVGAEMNGFLDQGEREVILAGFNSKRYDSRILFFEHDRHNLAFSNSNSNSNHLCFVDFRDIFPHFFKLTGKKTLGAYHEHVTGEPISNAHTAVGDCLALQTIVEHISDTALLYELIAKKKETVSAVTKRCVK